MGLLTLQGATVSLRHLGGREAERTGGQIGNERQVPAEKSIIIASCQLEQEIKTSM